MALPLLDPACLKARADARIVAVAATRAVAVTLPATSAATPAGKNIGGDRAGPIYPVAVAAVRRIDALFDVQRAINR